MSSIKVSALTAKTSPSGSEELLINDGGTSKKITIATATADKLPLAGGTMTGDVSLGDNVKAKFGDLAGGDLQIYHNATDTYLLNETGKVIIRNKSNDKDISLESDNGSGGTAIYVLCDGSNGQVQLTHYGSTKLATTSTGIDVTGSVTCDGIVSTAANIIRDIDTSNLVLSGGTNSNVGANLILYGNTHASLANVIRFRQNGSERLRIDSAGDTVFYKDTGSEGMRWDASTFRLGIGVGVPDEKLDVSGNINWSGTNGTVVGKLRATDTDNVMLSAVNELAIYTGDGAVRAMHIDSSGNVGIGTSSPESNLHIEGDGVSALRFGNIGVSSNSALRISRNDTTISGTNALGYLEFGGNDTTSNVDTAHAYVGGIVEGTHSGGNNPTSLIFGTTPSSSATPTERLRIDSAGNVGIGTSSPGSKLHVKYTDSETSEGNVNSFANIARVNNNGNGQMAGVMFNVTGNGGVQNGWAGVIAEQPTASSNNADLLFVTRGTSIAERMRITSSGNVGIGTSSPVYPLQIGDGTLANVPLSIKTSTVGSGRIYFSDTTDGMGRVQYDHDVDALTLWSAGSEKVRIDSAGNVGIGTSSPSAKLHIESTTGDGLKIKRTSSGVAGGIGVGAIAQGLAIYATDYYANTPIVFRLGQTDSSNNPFVGGSEKMRIHYNGNVGIGANNPAQKLEVRDTTTSSYVSVVGADTGNAGITFGDSAAPLSGGILYNNSDSALRFFKSGFTEAMRIDSSGNVGIGTTAPETTIDLNGALLTRVNTGNIGLGTFIVGNGMTQQSGGELEFMHMWSGTMHSGDTIVFRYNATSWKSWWFEATAASTGGYGHTHTGGYYNNSGGVNSLETIDTAMWSTGVSYSGQNVIVTLTLNTTWIHPLLKIKFGCGGGEGVPQLSRCSLVITS